MKVHITTHEETVSIKYDTSKDVTQVTTRKEISESGTCRVNYRHLEYNEFEFSGREDFRQKFKPCVETGLLDFLGVRRGKAIS